MAEQQEKEGWQEALRRIEEAKRSAASKLILAGLGLLDLPDSLFDLVRLTQLDLDNNKLTNIPDSVARLINLRFLYLNLNRFTTIPDSLIQFTHLGHLMISRNRIEALPKSFGALTSLHTFHIYRNRITSIPASISGMANLVTLDFGNNQLTAIPDSISQLKDLARLDLHNNQLTAIPQSLTGLKNLNDLKLDGNPLPEELFAALKRGIPSLFRYLESTAVRRVYPRTVKLVLLGEPKSGKTTLLEALKGNPQPCDDSRQETLGVDVVNIQKLHPTDKQPMSLSVWDFAGQHIEHATHQFFLTENAIYLILWNARQGTGSGKHDLWYWLELLKMRVREPKFLLVATHTEHTPPDLNLSDIQQNYSGFQGHFPLELSTLTGFTALEAKILELAVNSPSLRAEWPPEWLAARDEVRKIRQAQPYMVPSGFRALLKKIGVTQDQDQKDAAGQLHDLGEILYYQERDEISNLVILDPKWVTELIALVVRSKEAREQSGILRRDALDGLWQSANLQPEVRDHLVHLMDWFDLTYSTGHSKDVGIVVEALPYSKPEDIKPIELPAGLPQMEMIFRFPSVLRHLPPGIPTWGFARAHRFSKCKPWRDAAGFEDRDTKSEALIVASDIAKEVRLRVAADYPPFFFGQLDAILRDTFKRYPGMEPERRLPCPCQPGCPTSYPYETVLKRWHDRKTNVICEKSGEDVAIETLLSGARKPETPEGLHALRSEMRLIATEQLRAQNEQMEKSCPSVFTLVPSRDFKQLDTWLESIAQSDELELSLYCEHESGWHATSYSLYRFRPDKAWFDSLKERWNQLVSVTKRVAPLAKIIGKAAGATWPTVEVGAAVAEKLPEAIRPASGTLSTSLGSKGKPVFIDVGTRYLLERLINDLDSRRPATEPKYGGLHPYLVEDGRLLWLCPDHLKLYKGRA